MGHILKNENITIEVDHPLENYQFSRFDWTGKISEVKFQDIPVSITERTDESDPNYFGKGFYNEFGIDHALGFEDAAVGEWFHKIGVGLLKKDSDQYLFHKKYEIKPAAFDVVSDANKVVIRCKSQTVNGYSYVLRKEIVLQDNSFSINYYLENTGEKTINTDEYNHNFTAINKDLMGPNYTLGFPFQLEPESFDEAVNPKNKLIIKPNEFQFKGTPQAQFFFSNLTGGQKKVAQWELTNADSQIGIREAGSFETDKINLWGWEHVISPELFYKISVEPGQSKEWSRTYTTFRTN